MALEKKQSGVVQAGKVVRPAHGARITEKVNEPNFSVVFLKPDPNKGMWENIEQWIGECAKIDPQGFKDCLSVVKELKELYWRQRSKGMNKSGSMQHALTMPHEMQLAIKRYYPEIFRERALLAKFIRKFPGFVVYK